MSSSTLSEIDAVTLTARASLVDDITYNAAVKSKNPVTATAILGPFWRSDAPIRANGSTISFHTSEASQVAFMYGKVTNVETGEPVANASVDVWQASTNGNGPNSHGPSPFSCLPRSKCLARAVRAAGSSAAGLQPARKIHHRCQWCIFVLLPAANAVPSEYLMNSKLLPRRRILKLGI